MRRRSKADLAALLATTQKASYKRSPCIKPAISLQAMRPRRGSMPLADAARWTGLRLHPREAGFRRIAEFLAAPRTGPPATGCAVAPSRRSSPSATPTSVLAWFADNKPLTGFGKYALARAIAREGDFDRRRRWRATLGARGDIGQGSTRSSIRSSASF
jgi:soluble lytic murein transglycosylase